MTVQEKIARLCQSGRLLMANASAAECSVADAPVRPCVHAWSDHPCILDYDSGHFRHLYSDERRQPALKRVDGQGSGQAGDQAISALERADRAFIFGACPSPLMSAALASETMCFVIEFDQRAFCSFVQGIDPEGVRNAFFLVGTEDEISRRVDTLFDSALYTDVFPAFFVADSISGEELERCRRVILRAETLYYRRKIYPLTGHGMKDSYPFRDIRRELFFDQQKHVYENLPRYASSPDISVLKNVLPRTPAIVAAAGPELDNSLEFIRENRDRAVLIGLNNALKTLVGAGLEPDIALVVDPATSVEGSFQGLPRLSSTLLVAHNYAAMPGSVFDRVALFGESLPELRRPTPSLAWHGSVLAAGFSLARHMGCPGCALVGAQLCSSTPFGLEYSKGSVHGGREFADSRLAQGFGLYPVTARDGRPAYASLNFLDAALWLNTAIANSDMPTAVLSTFSLLKGTCEPDTALSGGIPPGAALSGIPCRAPALRAEDAVRYGAAHLAYYRQTRKRIRGLLEGGCAIEQAQAMLEEFDGANISYLVQRFGGFDERSFQIGITAGRPDWLEKSLGYYFEKVEAMMALFQEILIDSMKRLKAL